MIECFEENGVPQVYEPPYGASYALEDDELSEIHQMESTNNILVWGVMRCFMAYDGDQVTVDSMLYV